MIKSEIKTYTKVVTEKVGTTMICDYCKKEIKNKEKYLNITSSHNDWGNDSINSFRSSDVHENCLQNYMKWLFSGKAICASLENADEWKITIETDYCNLMEYMGENNDKN